MDDDFDLEGELLEADRDLRSRLAAGDPGSRRMVYTWCEGAATEILRYLQHGHVAATADGAEDEEKIPVSDWRYFVLDGASILVEFSSDGTWTTRDGHERSWFGIIEGSPESIGGSIVRDLGLPRRSLHPRQRPDVQNVPDERPISGVSQPPLF